MAKEALLLDVDGDEEISCGVLALHCRNNDDDNGDDDGEEFAVMVGIGATSPFLHRDEAYLNHESQELMDDNDSISAAEDNGHVMGDIYLPLEIDDTKTPPSSTSSIRASPLAILSPSLIVGAGGKAIDSTILLRRAMEVSLSMYSADNGGVDWFVSHSLEGTSNNDEGSASSIMGGAEGVDVSSLARRVADMAQSSTQSLGGRYGRMLSVSVLRIVPSLSLVLDETL